MLMMAITTSSSTNVKPPHRDGLEAWQRRLGEHALTVMR